MQPYMHTVFSFFYIFNSYVLYGSEQPSVSKQAIGSPTRERPRIHRSLKACPSGRFLRAKNIFLIVSIILFNLKVEILLLFGI